MFFRAPSRGGRGRRAAVDLVVCIGGSGFLLVLQVTTFSIRTRREVSVDSVTASHSAHRELVPTYPHQVYRLVYSHLINTASSVDQ